jgi:ADP-ribosylation factor GTPase-activating protein 1
MDALKTGEVKRMELGGNKPWKDFFNAHSSNTIVGRDFESCTISERYDSEAGEEWKERLACKVEGRDYVPGSTSAPKKAAAPKAATVESADPTPAGSGRNTPLSRISSPPQRTASPSQKAKNEAYFARMGAENASRPDGLAPNQGGKYAGFGSEPPPSSRPAGGSVPTADDFQKDPVAALTKGFGWLSSTVSKQAATVHKSYIQPGIKSVQDGEFAAQAQRLGTQSWNGIQQGTKGLGEQFNKFVDPDHAGAAGSSSRQSGGKPEKADFWDSFGQDPAGPPKEKKEFWDDFASAGEAATQSKTAPKPTSIGTSAMKTSSGGAGGAAVGGKKEGEEGWGDW